MGLQLEARTRGKIVTFLKAHGLKLSIASYLAGIAWMALLVHHEFSAKNYFSENQLLPGLVDTRFSEYRYTNQIYGNIKTSCGSNERTLQQKVREELENMNLDVYQQSFYVPAMMLNGTNIYGFYRVPRASGVESIVLNVPLRRNCSSVGAISLMLGLAKYISKQSYWAKDIVFVLTEHDLYGMKAWLSSYFHEESKDVIGDNLYGHGGSIQAAIIFDFPTEHVTHFDLLIEGLNGQLPNLDVINLVFQIGRFESVPIKFAHQLQFNQPNHDFLANFQTLLRMMINQASGVPTGNHGLFFKYRIEAVTLRGVIHSQRNWERIYFEQQGRFSNARAGPRFIEGILRSINNMLEHFHQSFFLYVLPNTHRYISIGMYMPPLACLLLPLLVKLFMLWADIFRLDAEITSETENVTNNVYIPLTTLFQLSTVKIVAVAAIITWMFMHIFTRYNVDLTNIGNANIVIIHSVLLLTGLMILWLLRPVDLRELQVLQLYAILHLALLIGITSILNFSLAYFIASFSTPLVFVKWNTNTKRFNALLKVIFFAVINPSSVIYLMCILSLVSLKELSFDYELLRETLNLYKNIFSSLRFLNIMEIMNLDIISGNVLPLWLVFGCL